MDIWPAIHTERHALIGDLSGLTEERWSTPSLCPGWSIEDVVAHMVATARMAPPRFFVKLAGSGFRFHAMSANNIREERERAASGAGVLAALQSLADATDHPPGPLGAMLGEAVVHGEDVRRPLGVDRRYPDEVLTAVADFFKSSNLLLGGKRRVSGLHLRATDVDWSSGSGPEVTGPMKSLVIVIAGRRAGLDDLAGEGVARLRAR